MRAALLFAAAVLACAPSFCRLHAQEKVQLSHIAIRPAYPGTWTSTDITLLNKGHEKASCEVEVQLGDVESGIHSYSYPFEIPGGVRQTRSFPILLPDPVDKGPVFEEKKDSQGKVRIVQKPPTKRQNFPFMTLLKSGTSVIQRETFLASLFTEPSRYYGLEIWVQPGQEPDKVLPVPLRDGYYPAFKRLELYSQESGFRADIRDRIDNDALLPWKRMGEDILILEGCRLRHFDEKDILEWVSTGGLLVLDPAKREHRSWWGELSIEPGEPFLSSYPPRKNAWATTFSSNATTASRGQAHFFGPKWSEILTEAGEPLAATREWGLGRILALNFPMEHLVQRHEEVETALLSQYFPAESLFTQAQESLWNKEAGRITARTLGFRVWPKAMVGLYLGLFLAVAGFFVWWPLGFGRGELRWFGWIAAVLAWTVGAALLVAVKSERKTKVMHMRTVIQISREGSGGAFEVGLVSFISGAKRAFRLNLPQDWIWKCLSGKGESKSFTQKDSGLIWEDFRLFPGKETLVNYRRRIPALPAPAGSISVSGKEISVSLPKEWEDGDCAAVVGRRAWFFHGKKELRLACDDGVPLGELAKNDDWRAALCALARSESGTMHSSGRSWLARIRPEAEASIAGLPPDVEVENRVLELLDVPCSFGKGPLRLAEGMSDVSFLKGAKNSQEKTDHKAFDGCLYRSISENMGLTVIFRPPKACPGFVPDSAELYCDIEAPPGKKISLCVEAGGRMMRLETEQNGRIRLPAEACKGGLVKISLNSETKIAGGLVVKDWIIRRFELSMNGENR